MFHTVGPIYSSDPHPKENLIKCYVSCLNRLIDINKHSIVFCCILTGEYNYPNNEACFIALSTVKYWLSKCQYDVHIIFLCVYPDKDYQIYDNMIRKIFNYW